MPEAFSSLKRFSISSLARFAFASRSSASRFSWRSARRLPCWPRNFSTTSSSELTPVAWRTATKADSSEFASRCSFSWSDRSVAKFAFWDVKRAWRSTSSSWLRSPRSSLANSRRAISRFLRHASMRLACSASVFRVSMARWRSPFSTATRRWASASSRTACVWPASMVRVMAFMSLCSRSAAVLASSMFERCESKVTWFFWRRRRMCSSWRR